MGIVYDTTDVTDTSVLKKSKLNKNFNSNNYWIESYQHKVDRDWRFATNVVDVDEQIVKFNAKQYVVATPEYQNIEVRITSAYDEKGIKLSDDYKNIIFKDVHHPLRLGTKYFFDQRQFGPNVSDDTKSVWLNINFDTVHIGSNALIRRCSGELGFLINGKSTEWYEPAIIDYDPKYTINYFAKVLNTVKSECYATLQFNEYTKDIQVNDRFILGALDFDNISNNSVYKVKEVFRFGGLETSNPNDVPLLILALDRDVVNPEDDLIQCDEDGNYHFIANYYSLHKDSPVQPIKDQFYIKLEPQVDTINEGETVEFTAALYNDGEQLEDELSIIINLPGCSIPESYFAYQRLDNNHFNIQCIKRYYKSTLEIIITAREDIMMTYNIQLDERL